MNLLTQTSYLNKFSDALPEPLQGELTEAVLGLVLLLSASTIIHIIIRIWIIRLLQKLDEKTSSEWYNALLMHKLPQRALFIIPLVVLYYGIPLIPEIHATMTSLISRITAATMILVVARVLDALLSAGHTIYLMHPKSGQTPIKSYIQLGKVLVYLISALLIIASLADRSPLLFLSGIGAITAILLLVFRDTILSLVASVQLTNNDVLRVGDWVDMPQFGADGDVIDIALNNVRVQNWDRTITVIPTHKFLEHSFVNWRGMQESGGRRIMRNLNIDIHSIRFLSYPEISRLAQSHLLKDYIERKMKEVNEYNKEHLGNSKALLTNGRWLTNIGTFRAYVMEYLKNHPRAHKKLLTLVRQLQPTENGLPLQVYVFTNTTAWAEYEAIQADIFDHLISMVPEFGLRIYQKPTGFDLQNLKGLNQ